MRSLIIVLALCSGCSMRKLSRMQDWGFGGSLAYDVNYRRAVDPAPVDGVATGAIRVRGGAGPGKLGWGVGVDLAAGGSHPRGFAWRAVVSPIGIAIPLGRHGFAGVIGGAGGSGITGRVDSTLEMPVEVFATVRAGRLGVSTWAAAAWLPFSDSRDGGAPDVGFVDELRAGITFRAGRSYHKWSLRSGNGYHLGVLAAEESGARFIGVTIGYDLDVQNE